MGAQSDLFLTQTYVPQSKWSYEVKKLYNFRCAYCGSDDKGTRITRLESHHILQRELYPEFSNVLENGICLCHKCHHAAHDGNYTTSGLKVYKTRYTDIDSKDVKSLVSYFLNNTFVLSEEKERMDNIKAHAETQGESVNSFINRAIDEAMERDRMESNG